MTDDFSRQVLPVQSENAPQRPHYTESPMYKAFQPVLCSMKLAGLYYERDAAQATKWNSLANKLYPLIVIIAMWSIAAINMYPFKDITGVNPVSFSFLNQDVFYIQCASSATCLFIASLKENSLKKFFVCLSNLDKFGGVYTNPSWFKRVAFIFSLFAWLLFIFTEIFTLYIMFEKHLLSSAIPRNLVEDQATFNWLQLITILCTIYFSCCWFLTNCFLLLIGILLNKECQLYTASFSTKLNQFAQNQAMFENERMRFIELTRIIKAADRSFSLRQATSFSLNVFNICVMLYVILYFPDLAKDHNLFNPYLFWLMTCFCDISIACISGILITSGVSILKTFYIIVEHPCYFSNRWI